MIERAIMFHHFHGGQHPVGQGSLSAGELDRILRHLTTSYTVLDPRHFMDKALDESLAEREICLTFDDGLRCQLDIAEPILHEHGLSAFFFVYSGVLLGQSESLEVFRDFRNTQYRSIEDFYADFFRAFADRYPERAKEYEAGYPRDHLAGYKFYSDSDRRFRYVRDFVLSASEYEKLMSFLMSRREYSPASAARRLWLDGQDLRYLQSRGHEIGLHSHTHPTRFDVLTAEEQAREYEMNKLLIEREIGREVISMSHPCGLYNDDTLKILSRLGVRIGFRADKLIASDDPLQTARLDHADLMRELV